MIIKTKALIKKLGLWTLEFFLLTLIIVSAIGYFFYIIPDIDWTEHTISFIMFSYLFYKLNITSILFGKSSRFANIIIISSYFSLFFKDIIIYTKLVLFKFKVLTFINDFYLFFGDNYFIRDYFTLYLGIIGLLSISMYITRNIEISHPSFSYAVYSKKLRNRYIKFLMVFTLLLAFYYLIYNNVLEWLEFTLDDPIMITVIVYYIHKIIKHHKKFHADNFVFKIGDLGDKLYTKFISLFHYKSTLTIAISGLLVLHTLADSGVFAYSMIFSRQNVYIESLRYEPTPFLKLFFYDSKNLTSSMSILLLILYTLNSLSLIIFLVLPMFVWIRLFYKKELHLSRIYLFFIYSSFIAYLLLPAYRLIPLSDLSINIGASVSGVGILPQSLLESDSILSTLITDKSNIIITASIISIIIGLVAYILSSNPKIKIELYAISIIAGLIFYTTYLYYFFGSLILNIFNNILLTIQSFHLLISIVFIIFLIISIIFYVFGYIMFLYEIIIGYHNTKYPEVIDEELNYIIKKLKKL